MAKPFDLGEFLVHLDRKAERGEYAATAAVAAEVIRGLMWERERARELLDEASIDLGCVEGADEPCGVCWGCELTECLQGDPPLGVRAVFTRGGPRGTA